MSFLQGTAVRNTVHFRASSEQIQDHIDKVLEFLE